MKFLFLFFLALIINLIFINTYKYFRIKKITQDHDTHLIDTPRLGGISLILSFILYLIYSGQIEILKIVLISMIAIFPAIFEDFRINISPFLRLVLILICSLIIITNINILPTFEINFLNKILNNYVFQVLFFTFSLSVLTNGQNIIDGTNGLSALTSISIFASILILGYHLNNTQLIENCFVIIILIISFLCFNFPFGKIFLGDSGSYFLGIVSGYFIIDIFGANKNLSSWIACIIIFYPVFEVIFSYFRKIILGRSPFYPDHDHLHLLLFSLLRKKGNNAKFSNPMVTLILSIIWLPPCLLFTISIYNQSLIYFSFALLIFTYLICYLLIKRSFK